ncbi:MAG: phosphoenolpyruvate---glycerone phosphotransferase subunit DhaL, partial [Thermoleophilaceae bacterium]|nr:phosphoenolpyruvate---glycerone phosphotransferase subunit DhaL [Thermoleophilaceae bacterium]
SSCGMLPCTLPHCAGARDAAMIAGASVQAATVTAWMSEIAESVAAERDYLTQLDAAIGDGDHGINMDRGFGAVQKALAEQDTDVPPGRLLIVAGKTLVSTVGGASGPLWGSAFRRAGRALGDAPEWDAEQLVEALAAARDGVVELGAATEGDKTMVDALTPAVEAMRSSLDAGADLPAAVTVAAEAAEDGARSTVPLQARKGRASYLGERSIGHQDPGATSVALVMRALERAVAREP